MLVEVTVRSITTTNIYYRTESIKTLVENDTLVIAAGGGGIPVIREQHDSFKGIDAVIDKDKTSALLGADIHCDQLIILTAIDYVLYQLSY